MKPEYQRFEDEPYARKVLGVVQKTARRWLVVLECGHTQEVFAQSIRKVPVIFFCSWCRDKDREKDAKAKK